MITAPDADTGMTRLDEIVQSLRQILPVVRERFHVVSLGVFGSYVRGLQTEQSDLDLLVSFSKTPSLFKLVDLENYLADELHVKVDLVMKESLKPRIGERILREVIPV